ncbi:MAG: hypothetical protein WB615_01770 [Candidatus Tumulicola sp.]
MATGQADFFKNKPIEFLTLLVTVLGVLFAALGVHLRPDYVTGVLICTYFVAGIALVAASYLLVSYTSSGQKRQPIAREILALGLVFVAWLLTWTATFEVHYMQPGLPSSWTILPFSYDITGLSTQDTQRQPFLAADGSTVILRVTGTETDVQYTDPIPHFTRAYEDTRPVSAPPVQYAIELDDEPIPGGPWTFDPEVPKPITIPNLSPSSFRDGMHVLRVYPIPGPYKMRLTLNCIIEIQKAPN